MFGIPNRVTPLPHTSREGETEMSNAALKGRVDVMRRWSAEKLEKELTFAAMANDGSPECEAWLLRITKEIARRSA